MIELTNRELTVLKQAARGLSIKESCEETFHEEPTVKFHRTNIIKKLEAKNICEAISISYQLGILKISENNPYINVIINGVEYVPKHDCHQVLEDNE